MRFLPSCTQEQFSDINFHTLGPRASPCEGFKRDCRSG